MNNLENDQQSNQELIEECRSRLLCGEINYRYDQWASVVNILCKRLELVESELDDLYRQKAYE